MQFYHNGAVTFLTMVQLSDFQKGRLCGLMEAGMTIRDVAERMQITTRTVQKWWHKYLADGNVKRKSGSGRPSLVSCRQKKQLILKVKRNRFTPVSVIAQEMRAAEALNCSMRTARRLVYNAGYKARIPAVRIPLGYYHRRNRLQWAREHLQWDVQWHSILWTDESRFALDFHDGRIRVRRLPKERFADCCIVEHDRYGGGSLMVWAGIWWQGRTQLVVINGNLNGERYLNEVVVPHIQPTIQQNNLTVQQDNAPAHRARIVMATMENLAMLPWPARSPDLSPIEHIWDELGRMLHDNYPLPPVNLQELEQRLLHEWDSMPQERIENVISSMHRRLEECIQHHGGHTSY